MGALRYKKTKTDDAAWDSSKAIPNAEAYAYFDDERNSYKLPHHFIGEDGKVGAASVKACQAAIAYLEKQGKAEGLSDEDIVAAYNHLAAHLKDAELEAPQLNGISTEGVHSETFRIEANSFEDDGEGTLTWPNGQVLMDGENLRSGYRYDIETMDTAEFNGSVTEDHTHAIRSIIAKTEMYKRNDEAIVMNRLQFAVKENPAAQVAYDLYRGGYAKDFSIETYGPWPDQENVFYKARVSGLSCVVVGNSRSATMNSVIANSLATAQANKLDTTELEQTLGVKPAEQIIVNNKEEDMKYKTVKNGQAFTVKVSYKNAAGDDTETELAPGATVDVAEDQAATVEKQVNEAKDPTPAPTPLNAADLTKAIDNAFETREKKMDEKLESFEKKLLDNAAQEPGWRPADKTTRNSSGKLEDMDWKERTALQLQSLQASFGGNRQAAETANAINSLHLEQLQAEGLVSNSLDLPDLGNFVIPKEMITEIKEQASNYSPLLSLFPFQETLSLDTAWITGTGEIEMEDVDMNDPVSDDADLKPIDYPSFDTDLVSLKEFAAVTPIKTSAIRFAAVDVVSHLTKLYRRAYDRKLAQSVIGRLEKAVENTGNTTPYDYSTAHGGDVNGLVSLLEALSSVAEHSPNGVYLMTEVSRLQLLARALRAGQGEVTVSLFTKGADGIPLFLGKRYGVVPSDLMPNLNTAGTKSWTFEGTSVTVNSGILLADPADFVGRVSGGLNFQVSDVASYEENGSVKSAFQRDELVFRGYGYRASGLYFENNVAGVTAPGIS